MIEPAFDPGRLPAPLAPLVGREREVAAVAALLGDPAIRLVTLTGPGGVGKTRLAMEVATAIEPQFADGAYFVSLAPIRSPDLVLPAIGQSLGVREDGNRPLDLRLRRRLQDQRVLLVLDNFEHVADAATQVAALLLACPRLTILTTSRATLHLGGEHDYPVPPLGLPDPGTPPSSSGLAETGAVALFLARARAVRLDFSLSDDNAAAVSEICRRLDGLPLAIELAAARIKILSPEALLARLNNRLQVLTGGARDLPSRLQTMRDAIAWSYDLLDPDEQALFRRLAVFVGGFTLEAAEWVTGDGARVTGTEAAPSPVTRHPRPSTLDSVASLVDKSLLHRRDGPGGDPRFGMLETIREFGLAQLEATGEAAAVRTRHANVFLALTEQAATELTGPKQVAWLDRLELEHDNLRAALSWFATAQDTERFARLAYALERFWRVHGHLGEGRSWLERAAVELSGNAALRQLRAKVLLGAGQLAHFQCDESAAWRSCGREAQLSRHTSSVVGQGMTSALRRHVRSPTRSVIPGSARAACLDASYPDSGPGRSATNTRTNSRLYPR